MAFFYANLADSKSRQKIKVKISQTLLLQSANEML